MQSISKIELKIKAAELVETFEVLNFSFPMHIPAGDKGRNVKRYLSILESINVKLGKKVLTHQNKTKPFKLTLAYHEADCIYETLSVFDRTRSVQNLFDKLDQAIK